MDAAAASLAPALRPRSGDAGADEELAARLKQFSEASLRAWREAFVSAGTAAAADAGDGVPSSAAPAMTPRHAAELRLDREQLRFAVRSLGYMVDAGVEALLETAVSREQRADGSDGRASYLGESVGGAARASVRLWKAQLVALLVTAPT
jgi:hypothetical protein